MTKNESAIPVSLLFELLSLDVNGDLYWRARRPKHFKPSRGRTAAHIAANWNSRYANTKALTCIDPSGHLIGRINNKLLYSHRVVYAMTRGAWPVNSIDHINGRPGDNRPDNLRDVPHKENLKNQVTRKNNTTGVIGVNRYKRHGNWSASITVDGRSVHLGYFDVFEDAVVARKQAELRYGYHENHGRKPA